MKKVIVLMLTFLAVLSCKNKIIKQEKLVVQTEEKISYKSFGDKITIENALSIEELFEKYKILKKGDTLVTKYSSKINEVCSKKGCWMRNDLGEEKEMMVRFKDYGFFMPLNAAGSNVIVEGKAFITEIPVNELQHYAEDAGKTKEEIEAITEPEYTYAFESNGVLIEE